MKKLIYLLILLIIIIFPLSYILNSSSTKVSGVNIEISEIINNIEKGQVVGEEILSNDLSSILILVNKEKSLPDDYIPDNMIIPDIPFVMEDKSKMKMRNEAASALEKLFSEAESDNIHLVGISAYRSYSRQKKIYENNVKEKGREKANEFSAQPGHSEHQTGLVIDISASSVDYKLSQEFGQTKEGKWLAENAASYGFIIRYPKDKEEITGYKYEPWHIRYVGKEHAQIIAENNLTLEEYLDTFKDILINL